jgi:hypothetical protein
MFNISVVVIFEVSRILLVLSIYHSSITNYDVTLLDAGLLTHVHKTAFHTIPSDFCYFIAVKSFYRVKDFPRSTDLVKEIKMIR